MHTISQPNFGEPHTPDPLESETIQPEPIPCSRLACDDCGRPFLTYAIHILGRDLAPVRFCEPCDTKRKEAEAEASRSKVMAARTNRFMAMAGNYYTGEEIRKAMPIDRAKACRALVQAGRGVMAHGVSGQFKTTCMINGALRWLILEGKEVTFMTAATWRQRASAAAKDCTTEKFLRPLKTVPWLFLDDLGNMHGNETAAEALNDLLEARVANGCLPILATTQYDATEMVKRFPREETGIAICRRLRLLAEPVDFNTPQPR